MPAEPAGEHHDDILALFALGEMMFFFHSQFQIYIHLSLEKGRSKHMVGSEEHIRALRLLDLPSDGSFQTNEEEETHLLVCEDCHQAVAVFALLFGEQRPTLMLDQPLS